MFSHREITKILQQAQELLQSGAVGGFTVRNSGHVETPIPVFRPDRTLHSWFVPVTVDKVLAGFFEFLPDLTLMRYSSFQRQENSLSSCPAAELWIDADTIRHRIETMKQPNEEVIDMFLSYDSILSHIAWLGKVKAPDGKISTVYVAGNACWRA